MTDPCLPLRRRSTLRLRAAAWLAAGLLACAGPAAAVGPSDGLIVQFKNAPTHEARSRARIAAVAAGESAGTNLADQEEARVKRVVALAGLSPRTVLGQGIAAQRLDFGRRLSGAEAAAMAEQLRAQPDVEWVAPNERQYRFEVPNDPMYPVPAADAGGGQWWLFPVGGSNGNALADRRRGIAGISSAWDINNGQGAPVIAVLDTGITAHPDIDPTRILRGYDFVSDLDIANDGDGRDSDVTDPGDWMTAAIRDANPDKFGGCPILNSEWHGTTIAGMLAATTNNSLGVAGIDRGGQVLVVRIGGRCGATISDIVDGMLWAAGEPVSGVPTNPSPARIVNVSFGSDASCSVAYQNAVNTLKSKGVIVVAAAGNAHAGVSQPANCQGVVGVAALNRDGFKSSYSNFGSAITVSTPGGDPNDGSYGAWDTLLGDGGMLGVTNSGLQSAVAGSYGKVIGTSFAAPVVSGVIGLMLSTNSGLTVDQIVAGLKASARPHVTSSKIGVCTDDNPGRCICTTATCGAGILDAVEAVRYALSPSGYVAPQRSVVSVDSDDVSKAVALGQDLPSNNPATPTTPTTPTEKERFGGALGGLWFALLGAAVLALRWPARRRCV